MKNEKDNNEKKMTETEEIIKTLHDDFGIEDYNLKEEINNFHELFNYVQMKLMKVSRIN